MDLNLLLDGHQVWLPAVAGLGVCVGLVAGMFGVGGGFLLVPLLHVVLASEQDFSGVVALSWTPDNQ